MSTYPRAPVSLVLGALLFFWAAFPMGAQSLDVDFRFEKGDKTVLPIELASGKVHVQARFDGEVSAWLLLDSGANMSILDRSLTSEMGLALRGESKADTAAGGRAFRFAFTRSPALELGGLRIEERSVAVLDRKTQPYNGRESRGLLGADLFRAFVIDIDYANRTMTLHRPETFDYRGSGAVLPVTFDPNHKWLVEGAIVLGRERLEVELLVDTGARGTIGFMAPFTQSNAVLEKLPQKALGVVGFGVGGEGKHWVGRVSSFELGPYRFDSLPATFAPVGEKGSYGREDRDGIVGAKILEQFRVIFDRSRSRLILERADDPIEEIDADASGLFLKAEGAAFDEVVVASVLEGGPGEAAGLRPGDRIVRVDGKEVVLLDNARELLEIPGKVYRLTIAREGRDQVVEVVLETRRLT